MNILCGKGQSIVKLDYTKPDMKVEKTQLADFVELIYWDMMERISSPLNLISPDLCNYQITATDKRYFKNVQVLRDHIYKMIKERQARTLDDDKDVDMISILSQDPTYKDDFEGITDDVIVMFLAGSKTLQTTTTNLITHLLHRPDIKEKIFQELNPVLEKCKEDFMTLLTTQEVDELEYLKMCYYETMRFDSPIAQSGTSTFSKDVVIGGVRFP